MTLKDLNIQKWQDCLTKFLEIHKDEKGSPAIRIENTPFTSARYEGGMTYDGHMYTYFEPVIPGNTDAEGLPAVAWLMVRDDFLKFAKKEIKDFNSKHDNSNNNTNQ